MIRRPASLLPPASSVPARGSLHQRILADLEGKILSGTWPPGFQIPFEEELARTYSCSRMTVNKVMTQIAAAGLIERRRKAGSFVKRPQSHSAVLEISDIRREVESLKLTYAFEIVRSTRRTSLKRDRQALGLSQPADIIELLCLHFAGHQPFCIEERIINLAAVPEAGQQDFTAIAPGAWLMARVPWTAAEHKIRAVGANDATAASLQIPKGTPCLQIDRHTWEASLPITFVRLTYPGGAQELVARFTPYLS